ncbi:2260_t:CDS:1, partial [Dentiscutata erythropus]
HIPHIDKIDNYMNITILYKDSFLKRFRKNMRITRSLKKDPNGETIHCLQEHIKFLNREIKRCKKESHINLLNQEILRAKNLEEKLRLKEITIENANQELNKLRQEIALLKGVIEEKNKTINTLQEENESLRNSNEELAVEVEHF